MTITGIFLIFIISRAVQLINAFIFSRFLENGTNIWWIVASVLIVAVIHFIRIALRNSQKTTWILSGVLVAGVMGTFLAGPAYFAGFLFALFFYFLIGAENNLHLAFENAAHIPRSATATVAAMLFLPVGFIGEYFGMQADLRYVLVFAVAEWILLILWTREKKYNPEVRTGSPPLTIALFIIGFAVGFYFAIKYSTDGAYMLEIPMIINILGVFYVAGIMMLYMVFTAWVNRLGIHK